MRPPGARAASLEGTLEEESPRLLLAVDTSTSLAGLALYDGQVRTETVWWAGRAHARQLVPAVSGALERLALDPIALGAVAAARGPGSFTGLRVGLAVARGLAFALGVPLFGLGSLDVVAAGLAASDLPVRAVLDAGRGRFATALYRRGAGGAGLIRADEILGVDLDGLVRLLDEPCTVAGDVSDQVRHRLAELGPQVRVASPAASVRRPALLAELAWRAWTNGEWPGVEDGDPIYLATAASPG